MNAERPEQLFHKGRPVPWIARWTSELRLPGPQLVPHADDDGRVRLAFADETPHDRVNGLLFHREGDSPGVGEPMWADVHSHRQNQAQREGRCQVCGIVIEGPIPWILPHGQLADRVGRSIITDVAPTCTACIPIASKHCPHLRHQPFRQIEVRGFRVHGYFGDIVDRAGTLGHVRHYQADRRLSGYLGNLMVRQTIVELWDHRLRRT